MEAGVGGDATILFTVKADGSMTDAMIVKASDIRFGDAAREAVLEWRFRPALLKGKPVDCRLMVPIKFKPPTKEGKR
jgi:protein TonB